MFTNYIKTALRFLSRNLNFTLINIAGLTTGIVAFLLISLYLQNELSYDNQFKYAQTYRMVGIQEPPGIAKQDVAITSGAWAGFARENIPGVIDAFRIMHAQSATIITEQDVYREPRITFSEGAISEYFGLPLVYGNPKEAVLSGPNQALINLETAETIFGEKDVVGKTFRNAEHLYTIKGVFDNSGVKTHWESNIFLSISTVEPSIEYLQNFTSNSVATYIIFEKASNTESAEQIINSQYNSVLGELTYSAMPITFYLQKTGDIYLHSQHIKFQGITRVGNIKNIYIFSVVALLILAIACINFINLATANSSKRAREIGLRKVMGANRNKLAFQFIGESMMMTLFSLLLALGLIEFILPSFNNLLDTELKIDFLHNPLFNIGLLAILVVVGLTSGLYPAIYLSRFEAARVLKPGSGQGKPRAAWLRKALVVIQFTVSTAMIMGTLIVVNQVYFMRNKDRGFDPEHVLFIPFSPNTPYEQMAGFRNRIMSYPEVKAVGIASNYNGVAGNQGDIVVADSVSTRLMVRYGFVDPDYFPSMNININQGRNFSHQSEYDQHQSVIINQATARALGWEQPIGQRFRNPYNQEELLTVIGVVNDYNYYSLRSAIEPAVYAYFPQGMGAITIRYQTGNPQQLIKKIEDDFRSNFPEQFFTARFVDEIIEGQIRSEKNIMKIFGWFSALCIVISCLGLFGLTSYMVNQKRREISIRKVLGGSVWRINKMLLKDFMLLVFIASLIALPITYQALERWLAIYPYRISIGVFHFSLPVILIVLIAVSTILTLSIRAARQNPSENLKYE
jgi:putative ABC transport system permease protein